MESSRIGVLAVLYNVCSYLFSPVLLCLNAVWYYETKSFLSEGDGSFTFLVFMMAWVPEGIFRLKWKIDSRLFVLFCVSLTVLAQMGLGRLFFAAAPMTRRMAFFITLMEFAWTIILELDEEFREYIISCDGFGYFVPCAQDSEISKLLLRGWDIDIALALILVCYIRGGFLMALLLFAVCGVIIAIGRWRRR